MSLLLPLISDQKIVFSFLFKKRQLLIMSSTTALRERPYLLWSVLPTNSTELQLVDGEDDSDYCPESEDDDDDDDDEISEIESFEKEEESFRYDLDKKQEDVEDEWSERLWGNSINRKAWIIKLREINMTWKRRFGCGIDVPGDPQAYAAHTKQVQKIAKRRRWEWIAVCVLVLCYVVQAVLVVQEIHEVPLKNIAIYSQTLHECTAAIPDIIRKRRSTSRAEAVSAGHLVCSLAIQQAPNATCAALARMYHGDVASLNMELSLAVDEYKRALLEDATVENNVFFIALEMKYFRTIWMKSFMDKNITGLRLAMKTKVHNGALKEDIRLWTKVLYGEEDMVYYLYQLIVRWKRAVLQSLNFKVPVM